MRMAKAGFQPPAVHSAIPVSLAITLVAWPQTSMPKRVAELIILLFELAVEIVQRLRFVRWRRE